MADIKTIRAVKTALRISHDALDEDIKADIDACLKDLEVCGINYPIEEDALILHAIKLHARTTFTDDVNKAKEYQAAYDSLKGTLQIAEGYGGDRDE